MNFIDAYNSGRPIKLPNHYNYMTPVVFEGAPSLEYKSGTHTMHFIPTIADVLSTEWTIEEKRVDITSTQFWKAFAEAITVDDMVMSYQTFTPAKAGSYYHEDVFAHMEKTLGLK